MSKTIIVVSSYVDDMLQTLAPDTNFYIFNTLTDLSTHIERSPISAESLFVTSEIFEESPSIALKYFCEQIKNPFLKTKKVVFIVDTESLVEESIEYFRSDGNYENWDIEHGPLGREYVSASITGTLKTADYTPVRKAVYRIKRSEYVEQNIRNQVISDNEYALEDEMFRGFEPVEKPDIAITEVQEACKVLHIAGIDSLERTLFLWILAQYIAFTKRVIIIEKDFDYLTLSDIAARSEMDYTKIDIQDIYANPKETITRLNKVVKGLVVISSRDRGNYDYNFICNFIYNNVCDNFDYIIKESNLDEVTPKTNYTVVIPSTLIETLKTVENIPDGYSEYAKFVAVNTRCVNELIIPSTECYTEILGKLLNLDKEKINIPLFTINSLKIGGEIHDLRMFFE